MSLVRVRLTPAGCADRIEGRGRDEKGEYLRVRVRAAAEDNKANRALEAPMAKAFGVPKSKVRVRRGATARLKTLEIDGASEAEVAAFVGRFEEGS